MFLVKANDGVHKYIAVFPNKRVPFGNISYEDYTISHDKERRRLYLLRHKTRESWNDPYSPGALSRWILWGSSISLQTNLDLFKKRFNL